MSFLQKDYWSCPFCGKGIIEVLVRPSSYKYRKTYGGKGGGKTTWSKTKEEIIICSEKCPICNASSEQIEKKWKSEGML